MNFDHDLGSIQQLLYIDTSALPPLGGQIGTLTIEGTGAIRVPTGAVGDRPATPSQGMLRFNSTSSSMEYHDGTSWVTFSASSSSVSSVTVSSSTAALTFNQNATVGAVTVDFNLDPDLTAIAALSGTGFAVRTAADTWATRTIAGTAGNVLVTDGNGVSGNPVIDLENAGTPVTDQFVRVTTDAKGRVTSTSAVSTSDITSLVDSTYVNVTGDSMSSGADLTFSGGGEILGLPTTPSGPTAAASKAYVDSRSAGLDPKESVRMATTANITLSGLQTIDGITTVAGDRVLVKNQTNAEENGIYIADSGAWVRSADADTGTLTPSAYTFIEEGTLLHDTGWTLATDSPIVVGTTGLTWTQFSGAGAYTAGTGLDLTGTQFSLETPVAVTNGGTGISTLGTSNQFLSVNPGGTANEYKTITSGLGIDLTFASGSLDIANSGVLSLTGTANEITVSSSTGDVTLSLPSTVILDNLQISTFTANAFTYTGTSGALLSTSAATDGQLLIGSTGGAPVKSTLTAGTGIQVVNAAGSITVNNTGVTSVALTVPSIFSVTGSPVTTTGTFAVTLESQAANLVFASPDGSAGVPTFRGLVYSDLPIQLYDENPSTPVANVVSGSNATAIGSGASASLYGQKAEASGVFVGAGDAQTSTYVLRALTTNNTPAQAFLDGSSAALVPPNNSVWTFDILVSARRTDATGGAAGYAFRGVVRKDTTSASIALVGNPSKSTLGETNNAWNCDVDVNTTTGALTIEVTGENSKTIRWVAVVRTSEVTN